jgi:asparagine synthase (glutamine-hydrolysing)
MCGIVGFIGHNPDKHQNIPAAITSIQHRGPDGIKSLRMGQCSFGHARLKVIDLGNSATQPMVDPTTKVAITYNGEIYNFQELKSQYLRDYLFRTTSDTEVILALYQKLGPTFVAKLRGMFALAIWSPLDDKLFLARDRFGIKPLFVHSNGDEFSFASEIKALLTLGIDSVPNVEAITDYLVTSRNSCDQNTFFQKITSFPPGHFGLLVNGKLKTSSYWSIDLEPKVFDYKKANEKIAETLDDVFRLHLISDIPVGVSLSSGLDSNIILLANSRLTEGNVNSFTFGFRETEYDERHIIQGLNNPAHRTEHFLEYGHSRFLADLERHTYHCEVPAGGVPNLAHQELASLSRDKDIRVLSIGEGADEVFAGYHYYFFRYFRDLVDAGRIDDLGMQLQKYNKHHNSNFSTESIISHIPPSVERAANVFASDGTSLLSGHYLHSDALDQFRPPPRPEIDNLKSLIATDITTHRIPKLLLFQDRTSMASGVEYRVPFLDHKLVELLLSIPSDMLMMGDDSKNLLRNYSKFQLGYIFPSNPKNYMPNPQREWLKGPLSSTVTNYVDDGIFRKTGLFDHTKWKQDFISYQTETRNTNSFFIWKILALEALHRNFFND